MVDVVGPVSSPRRLAVPRATAAPFTAVGVLPYVMARTIELDDDLADRLADHCREDESLEEFIEELVTIYEHEGRFTDEGL